MSDKMIAYDFSVDTLISVNAPEGTDPDTLIPLVRERLREQVLDDCDQIEFQFDTTFDPETGAYDSPDGGVV